MSNEKAELSESHSLLELCDEGQETKYSMQWRSFQRIQCVDFNALGTGLGAQGQGLDTKCKPDSLHLNGRHCLEYLACSRSVQVRRYVIDGALQNE